MKLKYKRLSYFRVMTTYNHSTYIIGKDYGTFGSVAYYYIEKDGKVISHGNTRQKDAKRRLAEIIVDS